MHEDDGVSQSVSRSTMHYACRCKFREGTPVLDGSVSQSVSQASVSYAAFYGSPNAFSSLRGYSLVGGDSTQGLSAKRARLAYCPRCEARPIIVSEPIRHGDRRKDRLLRGSSHIAWVRCQRCWNYDNGIEGPCIVETPDIDLYAEAVCAWNLWVAQGMPRRDDLGHQW